MHGYLDHPWTSISNLNFPRRNSYFPREVNIQLRSVNFKSLCRSSRYATLIPMIILDRYYWLARFIRRKYIYTWVCAFQMFPTWNLEASNIDTNFDVRFYCACRYNVYNAYLAGRLTTRTVTLVHRTSSSERASVCDNVASNSLPTINHNPRACRANYRF